MAAKYIITLIILNIFNICSGQNELTVSGNISANDLELPFATVSVENHNTK